MSLRLEMLQVARLAPNLLQEASSPVAEYFLSQFNDDGGAADRAGQTDLYYTVFALEGLIALRQKFPPQVRAYLEGFGDGDGLDLVHLCCLARCWADLKQTPPALADHLVTRIHELWNHDNVYHCFLAWGALQDLGQAPEQFPLSETVLQTTLNPLARTTPTTAATVALLRRFRQTRSTGYSRGHIPGGDSPPPRAPPCLTCSPPPRRFMPCPDKRPRSGI